ncbi:MAG: asparaginase [Clostridia bacterium]|nr:asparaginase [Clostridia bacterium]
MKICVIFTGGTIGSTVSDGWIAPTDEMKYLLIEKYREITGDKTEFSTLNPYTILSENLSFENINLLTETVVSNLDSFDGIIVTPAVILFSILLQLFRMPSDAKAYPLYLLQATIP